MYRADTYRQVRQGSAAACASAYSAALKSVGAPSGTGLCTPSSHLTMVAEDRWVCSPHQCLSTRECSEPAHLHEPLVCCRQ